MKEKSVAVLMSVYYNEKPEYLGKALSSVFNQTLQPSQVVVVKDGPLSEGLEIVISEWIARESHRLKVIQLEKNCGLAVALNKGLEQIEAPFIARMDSDDISLPTRFEKQISYLLENPEVDILGSWIAEIDEKDLIIKPKVFYPEKHEGCFQLFAFRDPVAHPSVIFRSRFFLKAGNYSERHVGENKNEDTNLWYRGFKNGCVFANIPEVLLHFRRSKSFYIRRSGLLRGKLILRDRLVINRELSYGFKANLFAFAYFILGMLPSRLKKLMYQYLR